MAKVKQKPVQAQKTGRTSKSRGKQPEDKFVFPLERTNFIIIGVGLFLIVLGYIFMALPDHPDDFMTLTLAPILLVLAFVIIIPFGLLYRQKKPAAASD